MQTKEKFQVFASLHGKPMDRVANMLTMMTNAGRVGHETITLPYSNFILSITECLKRAGYVESVTKKTGLHGHDVIEVTLSYKGEEPKISSAVRVSKPSRRLYMSVKDIHPVRSGYGLLVLSTPKGVLTGNEAKKELVGGEVLFKVW